MALVTTVTTTPLTLSLYPEWYQKKLEAWKRGEIDWDGNRLDNSEDGESPEIAMEKLNSSKVSRLLVHLRLDSLSSVFTFISLLGGDNTTQAAKVHRNKTELKTDAQESSTDYSTVLMKKRPLEVHGLRLLELTERTSSVMKVSEVDEYSYRDPVVNAFRTFAQLNNIAVSGSVSVVPEASYAETLTGEASDHFSDLVLIPWSETGSLSEGDLTQDKFSGGLQESFIRKTLESAKCNTAVIVIRGFGGPTMQAPPRLTRRVSGLSLRSNREPALSPVVDRSHHIYFPFFGGVDDRVALRLVLQLAQRSNITATIIHFITAAPSLKSPEVTTDVVQAGTSGGSSSRATTQVITQVIDPEELQTAAAQDTALLHTLRDSLPQELTNRVVFVDVATATPLADCVDHARQEIGQSPGNAGDLIVIGRGKHSIISTSEADTVAGSLELRKTLGLVAESIISCGVKGSVLVIQAGGKGLHA
jgi:nucleotide-binding universal stress UspA family protein